MGKKFFKFILITLICSFAMNLTAMAQDKNPYLALSTSSSYNNLIKSFKMRAFLSPKNFYYINLREFEGGTIDLLTQVYIFGELKSERPLPEAILNMYTDPTPEGMLKEIGKSLRKLYRVSNSDGIHYYTEAKSFALKMIFVATQTISEFAPFLNLQDKNLKKVLVSGFTSIVEMQSGAYSKSVLAYVHNPYLRAVETGIKEMSKSLSPPNIFQKIYTSLKGDQSPQNPSQMEIEKTCSRIFQ